MDKKLIRSCEILMLSQIVILSVIMIFQATHFHGFKLSSGVVALLAIALLVWIIGFNLFIFKLKKQITFMKEIEY